MATTVISLIAIVTFSICVGFVINDDILYKQDNAGIISLILAIILFVVVFSIFLLSNSVKLTQLNNIIEFQGKYYKQITEQEYKQLQINNLQEEISNGNK